MASFGTVVEASIELLLMFGLAQRRWTLLVVSERLMMVAFVCNPNWCLSLKLCYPSSKHSITTVSMMYRH